MDEPRAEASPAGRPGLCRNCGAITGAGETSCHVCGAPAGAAVQRQPSQAQPRYDPETVRFARAILTRPATFTFVFLAANVFVFLLMYLSGGTENFEVLRAYGAKFNSRINNGEWWRLVTPVFIHIGWLHLIVNMYSLFILGPYVERLYGSARFVFFWIMTGIAGVAASYLASSVGGQPGFLGRFLFRGGDGPSAGASGALFGLVGVLFVFGIKFRHELPEGFKRAFGLGMLPTILLNLAIGYTIPFIDNAAHLGGFAAGAVLALFVGYKRPGQKASVAFAWHALQIVALALVVVGFGEVVRHFDGPAPALSRAASQRLAGNAQSVALFIEAHNEGQAAFAKALKDGDAETADRALEKLDRAPALDAQSGQLLQELKTLVSRARDYARQPEQERASRQGQESKAKLVEDFESWEERADGWVKNEGHNFGIGLREEPSPEATGEQPPQRGESGPNAEQQRGGEKK
ncbi:MAG TPA: rhomboid family intramembrane serine protease [Pyrinomonadaceae bacterium]|nr:rhomboid family intramembrane serine protease [Pyrinomonadaceae bacterium]